jgi:2-C-methyl-D-erythritol 4-phosphate cytidylyltransferase/2-C-methyl-D-erythritol 2,4-cyclodiphosphate synthase
MDTIALVVAAGRGVRAGLDRPKQYSTLAGEPVLRRTLRAFSSHPAVDAVLAVIGPGDDDAYQAASEGLPRLLPAVIGGGTRQESVRNGLEALVDTRPRLVLVHDAARPFVSGALIDQVIAASDGEHGAIPAMSVTETVKRRSEGMIVATVPREDLVTAQTPQAFPFPPFLQAHRAAAAAGQNGLTDDEAVAALAGLPVRFVEGEAANIKLTRPADFATAERMLALSFETRTAQGFDVHAFGPGSSVWLCGLEIPHGRGLMGHSDADVGLHALTDAILGTIGDGDIGQHFPPSDPQWKGAASDRFLIDAIRRVRDKGGRITHLDLTLICEEPKVGPHREAMRASVARIAGLALGRVSVKATTSERLGFTGRGEGIAALASATIELPASE